DDAAAARAPKRGNRGSAEMPRSFDVDRDDAVERLVIRCLERPRRPGDPGVVDDDVKPSEGLDRPRDAGFDGLARGDIGREEARTLLVRVDLSRGRPTALLVDVGDHDATRPFGEESFDARSADPARSPG